MYCACCWTDASYCPPQPDGSYLCPGCAGIRDDAPSAAPDGTTAPCEHLYGTHADGSCIECGYC